MSMMMSIMEWMHQGVSSSIDVRRKAFGRATEMWSHLPTVKVLELVRLIPLWDSL